MVSPLCAAPRSFPAPLTALLPPTPPRDSALPVRALLAPPRLSLPALVSASPLVVACLLDSVVLLLVLVAPRRQGDLAASRRVVSPVRRPRVFLVVEDPQVDLVSYS